MLTRRKVYLAKVESTKGTDSVPVVGSDLIVPLGDLQIQLPTEVDLGEGELKGTFGPGAPVVTKQAMQLEVATRVRGLGQGAGALPSPAIRAWLLASGHTEVQAGNGTSTARSATYAPSSVAGNLKSASHYFYEDGLLYKVLAGVNTLSFEAQIGAPLQAKATIQGPYAAPTVTALPSWSAPTQGIFVMSSALAAVTEAGGAVNISGFTLDTGASVENDYATGLNSYDLTDRVPVITIDPKAVASTTDFTRLTSATSIAIVATFTNAIGETLVFTALKAVPIEMTTRDRAGQIVREKKFQLVETSGDDQYEIEWTAIL